MNRNVAVNGLAYFCFYALAGTGLLLECRLCEDASGTILGLGAEDWSDVHEWVAYLFIAVIVLHCVLHWAWIKKLAAKHLWGTVFGLTAAACVMGALLLTPVEHSAKWRHDGGPESIGEYDD